MKEKKINELMVPLSEYAIVNTEDTLKTAIKTLYESHKTSTNKYMYKHRAVLVQDKKDHIVGKVGPLDVLRALEPKYCKLGTSEQFYKMGLSRFGLSNDFIHSLTEQYCLWDESCESLVKTASGLKIESIMYTPDEGEYVNEEANLAEAIHQFILGHHQSLLVLKKEKVIGILRLSDVFEFVGDMMMEE
ncbi:MAG: CBS domain-containing protein [Proteobacteria bacterium]|nr:CBS domain-containing protein [Pseudomonadota bacterium]MBU1386719.1 CBS domain-containing protein [Pseudomonadota bacterium]MBU1544367.1 CBS domain-containing protein [Pseudomonadota bacterium]MBU2431428.1 CBS domain-containing protein [Pseudomonadota bacterium]MBU2481745.1 CBS domain-containing protein [Pseudomonadota bacterium]